jgi:S-adenosylmethionine synthetase
VSRQLDTPETVSTAAHGRFGRARPEFTRERLDRSGRLQEGATPGPATGVG